MKTVALFDVPSIYDVAHSSDFPNQADNVLTVYRNMVSTKTEVYVQKIKFEEIGFIGSCEFHFDKTTRRFRDIPEPTFAENPENAIVLDDFLGSGTTALACQNTKRDFIGCEIDKDYYQICLKRIEKNINLFT